MNSKLLHENVVGRGVSLWAMLVFLGLMTAHATASETPADQRVFKSPEAAIEALVVAAGDGDMVALMAIFGPEGREVLSSGDPVHDRHNRAVFNVALDQQWTLEDIDDRTKELVVGHEQWPFPIPLVKETDGWRFDTAAGKQEVLARRVGRNELAAIAVCRIYALAQRQYASQSHDGQPQGAYAQKLRSEPGKHDGLYWAVSSPDEEPSPLSELAAKAAAAGYSDDEHNKLTPFHGYYYRILSSQGADAPGGAKDYIVDGRMTGGFALIAYPAEYGNSGIMTFTINHDGVLYETDLGEDTAKRAEQMMAYNPGTEWRIVE